MTLVIDASLVVSALVDTGSAGRWAESLLTVGPLSAPHLMPVEAANILRRSAARGEITADTAALAHADLLDLRVELFPYAPFASRVWELRDSITAYDAWYVALAEFLGAELATLDLKLTKASGPRCGFRVPPR
ncbi:MAG: type II toxin-antitoxin system VapC family toxin [Actinobacteria bacterium]|nr:type II toxin-antitoxin system VapC family toxin [Actinomycetota bacterium]